MRLVTTAALITVSSWACAQVQAPPGQAPIQQQYQPPFQRSTHGGVYPGAHYMGGAPPANQPNAPSNMTPGTPALAKPSAIPSQPQTMPALTSTQSQAPSMLQQPPTQATIQSTPNNLTIRADNASLAQTLQRIADKTGMQLEGISGDQRVFGDFGPGAPRDVLNTLLTGTGYNIVMIGALDNGAPRQLILSQKKADVPATPQGQQQQQQNSPDDDAVDNPPDDQPAQQQMVPPGRRGDDNGGLGARTPQQMLQQLQQIRQQQAEQQGNQVPPPQ
jgi:hypothetical protein